MGLVKSAKCIGEDPFEANDDVTQFHPGVFVDLLGNFEPEFVEPGRVGLTVPPRHGRIPSTASGGLKMGGDFHARHSSK